MKKQILSIAIITALLGLPSLAETQNSKMVVKSQVTKTNVDTSNTQNISSTPNNSKVKTKRKKLKDYKVVNKYDFVNMPWWENYSDENLNNYIQKAIEHNYDAKMATLTVDEYYQNVKAQFANELPTLGAGFLPGYGGLMGKEDGFFRLPMCVSYELDIFLKNHDKTKSVKKTYEASIQDERAAYISIVSAVGTTYFNLIKLDKVISTQQNIVNLRKDIYHLMLLSNQKGTTSVSDVVKANKSLIAGQSDLIDLEKQRIQLLNQLAVLIGESPANINDLKRSSYEEIDYRFDMPETISSDIIMQRPDFLKAQLMLEKAGIDVKVAKKEFLPTINLGGFAFFNSTNFGSIFTTRNAFWGLGGSVLTSLYTGGRKMANLRINKIRAEKALDNYKKVNLVSIQEVNDAMYKYKLSNDKYNQNLVHQKLESQDYVMSKKKFQQGIISRLDLDQFQENLLDINKLVVTNKLDCMIDSIGLYKATGAKY